MSFNPGSNQIATSQDVALSNPVSGQALTYDTALAKWENMTPKDRVQVTPSVNAGAVSIDATQGDHQIVVVGSNAIDTVTMSSPTAGQLLELTFVGSTTGTYVWPSASCVYVGGNAPTPLTAAGRDSVLFVGDGTSWNEVSRLSTAPHASTHAPGAADSLSGYYQQINNGGQELAVSGVNVTFATWTIQPTNGNLFEYILHNSVAFSLGTVPTGRACYVTVVLKYAQSTAVTVTFFSGKTVHWMGSATSNTMPAAVGTLSCNTSAVDIITFLTYDGGTNFYAFVGGLNYQ